MTTDNNYNTTRLDLTLLKTVPDNTSVGLVVEQAWLPMVIWERVSVVIQSVQGLTVMERFVVECLLKLKECQTGELQEIASIPPELANWLLSSLSQKGLARQEGGRWFQAETDVCIQALKQKSVLVDSKIQRDFIWFPQTEEMVVLSGSNNVFEGLRHINPIGKFPIIETRPNTKRGDIVREALRRNRLYGDDAGAISDADDDVEFDSETCPAYHARAILPHRGTDGWLLAVSGKQRRNRTAHSTGHAEATGNVRAVEQTLPVPMLPEIVRLWRSHLSGTFDSIQRRLCQRFSMGQVENNNGQLSATVHKETALPRDWLLVNDIGLAVRIATDANEIEYTLPLHLRPAPGDEAMEKMFAVDAAVQKVVAAPHASEIVDSACHAEGVSTADVVERLWHLKLFRKVYDLRETEDFAR